MVLLGQAEGASATLMSIVKPLLFFLAAMGWGRMVGRLDKDAAYYHLHRRVWAIANMAIGVTGFGLLLLIPWFLVGLPLVLALFGGAFAAYFYYHNEMLPSSARWELTLESLTQRVDAYQQAQADRRARVRLIDADGEQLEVPTSEDHRATAHEVLGDLLAFALPRGAERIELAVGREDAALAVRIDGVRYPQQELEAKTAATLAKYLKEVAGLDTEDHRRLQNGELRAEVSDQGTHDLGLQTWGSTKGMNVVLEIDPHTRTRVPFEGLGLTAAQQSQLERTLDETWEGGGQCLVAAPADNGLTTMLYSLLERHDPYTQVIVTLEPEPEAELEGVTHNRIGQEEDDAALAKRLGTMLRRECQVLMISSLLGSETARTLASADRELRTYVGLQASDTFQALAMWQKAVGDSGRAAQSLVAVVAGRLVRVLCTTCRVAYTPDRQALRKVNLPADRVSQLYKHSGKVMEREGGKEQVCPTCLGLGYRGRVGVYEVMALDDEARQLLGRGQLDQLRSHLRKQKMMYLQEAALQKVVDGTTSISELTRVFGQTKSGGQRNRTGTAAGSTKSGGGG